MRRAFTLIELIVVIGIVSIFLSTVLPNYLTPISHSSFASTLDVLVSNFRNQQIKAIQGDSANTAGPTFYGIHFNNHSYVLFSGATYQSADTTNTIIELDPTLQFSFINLPSSEVIFSPGTGEVSNFISPTLSGDLTLVDVQSDLFKVIVINKYGVVEQIN